MKNNQKGFGLVEVLIIIVVLGVIAWVGWSAFIAQQSKESNTSKTTPTTSEYKVNTDVPQGYKEYIDTTHRFSFVYPETWINQDASSQETGTLVSFISPENDKILKDFQASGRQTEAPVYSDLLVSHWDNINNSYAKGGEWAGGKTYSSLDDYFNDPYEGRPKQKIGEVTINGQKAYEVLIGGVGQSYGIMLERSDGIYQLEFLNISEKEQRTAEAKQIIDSFKFD